MLTGGAIGACLLPAYDHPFFLVFTLAIRAGETGGPDASTRWPATMLVDWVRVRRGPATFCQTEHRGCPDHPRRRAR
jgi:hypothetical protein